MKAVQYATEDVYAEIEEEGGKVNRLVAVEGQPIPAAFADVVDSSKTTTSPPESPASAALTRATAARRENGKTVDEAEREREKFAEEIGGKKSAGKDGSKARRSSSDKARKSADGDK